MAPSVQDERGHRGFLATATRVAMGTVLIGSVVEGHLSGDFRPGPWALGLVGVPAATLAWHRWIARRSPERLRVTGLAGHLAGPGVFLALYLTWWYAPAFDVTSDAALLFYGASMLLAAARGSRGCEVLAFSNWVLGRDDEVGCALFDAVDRRERRSRQEPDFGGPAGERLAVGPSP